MHTQNYHATADIIEESTRSSVWKKGVAKVAFWRSTESKTATDLSGLESAEITADIKSLVSSTDITTVLKQQAAVLKESMVAFVNTPMGVTVVFLTGVALVFTGIYLFVTGVSAWLDDIPFYVSSKRMTHLFLSEYQPLDVCQNFLGDKKDLERARWFSHYDHASGYNGVPFAEALPQWLNNATNLITMLGSAVLANRVVGRDQFKNSYEFENHFKKFLYVNAANIKRNYSCTFKLGERDHLDAVTGCQEDHQKDVFNSEAQIPDADDALIQFRRWDIKRGVMAPSDVAIRISYNQNHLNTQRYPQLDYSPNPAQIDDVLRMSTQRRLMQLDNQLTLPEAVEDRIRNEVQVMHQLNEILLKQRVRNNIEQAEIQVLTTLVGLVFNANQIALTSDIGCILDFENGMFKLRSCFEGNARNIPANAPFPFEGQVWFVRGTDNVLNHMLAFANKIPMTEAMAMWLKQSPVAMQALWNVANKLHQGVCNKTSDGQLDVLHKAAQKELMEHDAELPGDLGCDIRFNDEGAKEILCHSGTAPQPKVDGCDLESDIPVRWEGKLWLTPHSENAEVIQGVILATTPEWQMSRTQMQAFSPSMEMSGSAYRIKSHTPSNELSTKITSTNSDSASNELSQKVTSSDSDSESHELSSKITLSDSDRSSAEMTDDLTSSRSGSPSQEFTDEVSNTVSTVSTPYSPTLPIVNTTGNGITELYYVAPDNFNGGANVRRAFVNSTHILNDTLFLANTAFGGVWPYTGLSVDTQRQKIYWTTSNSTNNQYNNIYVADIVSNPTRLNNTRIIYSAPSKVWSLYLAKGINRMFWGAQDRGMYMGIVNITNFVNMTNITAQSMISTNSFLPYGFYYDLYTQSLLWSRPGGSPARYFIYLSTLNLQTETLMNTTILLNESSPITSVSYDVKNRRILFNRANEALLGIASFNFENPLPLTNITEIQNFQGAISVVND